MVLVRTWQLMRRWVVFPAMVLGTGSAAALADDGGKQQGRPVVRIDVAGSGRPDCPTIAGHVRTFLLGMNQYSMPEKSESPDHIVTVSCQGDATSIVWQVKVGAKKAYLNVASREIRQIGKVEQSSESQSYYLVRQIVSSLPWDGELIQLKKVNWKKIKYLEKGAAVAAMRSEMVTGFSADLEIGNCVPIEAMTFLGDDAEVTRIGEGVITDARALGGKAELALTTKLPKGRRMFFRILFGSEVSGTLKGGVERCKDVHEEKGSSILEPPVGFTFNQDEWVELHRVSQSAGFLYGQVATGNDLLVRGVVAALLNNRVELGDWATLEMQGVRSMKTGPYVSKEPELTKEKPEVTIADAHLMLRLEKWDLKLEAGPGVMIDKYNFPFLRETGTEEPQPATGGDGDAADRPIGVRKMGMRPSGVMNIGYDAGKFATNVRLMGSSSDRGAASGLHLRAHYELTKTWYTGMDLYYMSVEPTIFGEPGGSVAGFGFHIGIAVQRTRD